MATDAEPYVVQPVLSDLYDSHDLLDFSAPGTHHLTSFDYGGAEAETAQSTSPASPQRENAVGSLLSSVSQFAAGVSHRAAVGASPDADVPGSPTDARRGSDETEEPPARTEVRCVEGFANNLYVGGSDGVVEWWVYDGAAGTSENRGWKLQRKHKLFPCRPVSKIVLLPKVSRALILSEGTLHPLSLPGLEALPSNAIAPIRGVVSVVLNDDELDLGGNEDSVTDMTVVVVRKKGMGIYRLGARMIMVKEIPLPAPPLHTAVFSTYLCAALPSEAGGLTYCIIDLSDASLTEVLPVAQIEPEDGDWTPNPNVVVIPGENQFLVTSYTGGNTMGVFLNGQGDPERGTMEWSEHPLSIAVEAGYIIALLRNNTIVIHSLNELEHPAQTIELDKTLNFFTLSYSPYGISIRDVIRGDRMASSRFTLLSGKLAPPSPEASPALPTSVEEPAEPDSLQPPVDASAELSPSEEPPGGSGLTPPSSPKFERQAITLPRSSSLLSSSGAARKQAISSVIAETLLVGRHTIQGIVPTPVILQVEKLCSERRMDEAIAVVDEERRRGRRGDIDVDKATHSATVRFMHQYLACRLFAETVFERAGDYFIRGKVDPRLLVRLFPAYRGKTIGTAEEVEVYEGLQEMLKEMGPVEDIITNFLNSNSPKPDPAEAEELRLALYYSAKNMLADFLRKTRTSRRKGGGNRGIDSRKIDIVVDTTLAKLLAEEGTTNELLALLSLPNDVVLSELEPFLEPRKYVLSTVMRQQGRVDRVLELLKEIAESPTPDPLCEDPVSEIMQQLETVEDPELLRTYTLWLVKRDPERGLGLLIAKGSKIKVDDAKLIADLREVDPNAANRYLEYVVVGKRSQSKDLHEALLRWLLDQAEEFVADDGIKYHLEELDAEYRLLPEAQSYIEFFVRVAPETPFKTVRLKLVLFLQNSVLYDLDNAAERLAGIRVLVTERAIVLGRLGRHTDALRLLAQDLPDTVSAQTYCTQGGEIVTPKLTRAIARREPELSAWAKLGPEGAKKRRAAVDAETQHKLVVELLRAYMRDEGNGKGKGKASGSTARTAALLAAQGVHLDVLEVLDMAPNDWPLDVITTFYKRSYRRQLHDQAMWQVLKSISAGQNLETSERYLEAVRAVPPVTMDPPSDEEKEKGYALEAPESINEKDGETQDDANDDGDDGAAQKEAVRATDTASPLRRARV